MPSPWLPPSLYSCCCTALRPDEVAGLRDSGVMVRQEIARRMGIELDLTDEEWWQL